MVATLFIFPVQVPILPVSLEILFQLSVIPLGLSDLVPAPLITGMAQVVTQNGIPIPPTSINNWFVIVHVTPQRRSETSLELEYGYWNC